MKPESVSTRIPPFMIDRSSVNKMVLLNEAQEKAVQAGDGPILVLAGAGSGKTRVIVERLAWLIQERGIDPRNLLAVTFTNRAANEMKQRVTERLGVDRLAAWVGTFHSFGLFVLRREMEHFKRKAEFAVFDETDQLSLMKRLIRDLPPSFAKLPPREALNWISRLKQDLREPDFEATEESEVEKTQKELWNLYHQALLNASAVDFDDLLVLLVRLWEQHPSVLEKYRRRYRYIHVDEYQDTNHAQYRIATLLAGQNGNLFVVGDEDQSIYSWRGAHIRNILNFEQDFPGAKTFRLEQNYRSTSAILQAANAVVARNRNRLGKTLWTQQQGGDLVQYFEAADSKAEASFVVDELAKKHSPYRDCAVLYRTNGQARELEEAFLKKGIPYVIYGGIRFYARKEVKDLIAYLRLIVNSGDDEALRRVINVPPRGIGGVTMERIQEYALQRSTSLFEVLRQIDRDHTFMARARETAVAFVHMIDALALQAKSVGLKPLVESILERTQYREFVKQSDEKDFRTRLETVDEFLSACKDFDDEDRGGPGEFLQNLALVSSADQPETRTPDDRLESADHVTLMTCHSAKGLEFDCVFLIGLEEGLLPHAAALDAERDIEEERRLCYVAMTRARKRLFLASARSRTLQGESSDREVSRFVREIPPSLLKHIVPQMPARTPRPVAPPREPAEQGSIRLGTRVRHPKFGRGEVLFTTGAGDGLRARIRFETGRSALFLVSKTPLEILEEKRRGPR